jgi:hypothetical protein
MLQQDMSNLTAPCALLATVLAGQPAYSQIKIVDHSLKLELDSQTAEFRLRFDSVPDFYAVDDAGRQRDSFQLYLEGAFRGNFELRSAGVPDKKFARLLVRGGEIHVENRIRIREVVSNYRGSGDPTSGYWGPIVYSTPFELDATELRFKVPISALKGSSSDFSTATILDGLNARTSFYYYWIETTTFGKFVPSGTVYGTGKVAEAAVTLTINVEPPEFQLRVRELVSVTVWGDVNIDALQVDPRTIVFGPDAAKPLFYNARDVNRDGSTDLVLRFRLSEVGIVCGGQKLMLKGSTFGGEQVEGTDSVNARCDPPAWQ